jgi:hypothetical protein
MTRFRAFLLFLAALIIVACGGGGGGMGTTGSTGGGGGTLTEEGKLNLISQMGVQMNGWRTLPRATQNANLVTWAKTQPNVAAAAIAPETDNVWVRFTDGDATMYLNNRPDSKVPLTQIIGKKALVNDMPSDVRAYTIFSLEATKFSDATDGVRLDLNNQGYNATRLQDPTVEQVRQLNGAGVIFWQAHSGMLEEVRNGVKASHFGICIGQQATKELGAGAYKAYRDAGEVMVAAREIVKPDGTKETIPVYCVTDIFIAKYLKLADNAFVAMDSCTSTTPTLQQAFATAKAGTYVGWDKLAGPRSGERFALMFDRLLGANVEPPLSTPIERSFDIDAVENWMQTKAYDIDPSEQGVAQLKFFFGANKSVILRPTISRVIYTANNQAYNKTKFTIEGTFGKDPGAANRKVMWGTRELEVLSWNELEGIKVKLGPKPYPQDYIQVIRGTRKSNRVPMTEWTVPFTYTLTGQGTLKYVVTLNLKMRVDCRGARFTPEQTPQPYPMIVWWLDDSTGQVTASGSYKPNQNTTVTWSGGTTLKSTDSVFAANLIMFSGDFRLNLGKMQNFTLQDQGTFTQKVTTSSGTTTTTLSGGLDGYFTFDLPVNATSYVIPAGNAQPTLPLSTPYNVSASLTWAAASPVNPPTNNIAHREGR